MPGQPQSLCRTIKVETVQTGHTLQVTFQAQHLMGRVYRIDMQYRFAAAVSALAHDLGMQRWSQPRPMRQNGGIHRFALCAVAGASAGTPKKARSGVWVSSSGFCIAKTISQMQPASDAAKMAAPNHRIG